MGKERKREEWNVRSDSARCVCVLFRMKEIGKESGEDGKDKYYISLYFRMLRSATKKKKKISNYLNIIESLDPCLFKKKGTRDR